MNDFARGEDLVQEFLLETDGLLSDMDNKRIDCRWFSMMHDWPEAMYLRTRAFQRAAAALEKRPP